MEREAVAYDLSQYIERKLFDDRPHLKDRQIPVSVIVINARKHKWPIAELAGNFAISEQEALAALLYYEQHWQEIEAQEKAYREEYEKEHQKIREALGNLVQWADPDDEGDDAWVEGEAEQIAEELSHGKSLSQIIIEDREER